MTEKRLAETFHELGSPLDYPMFIVTATARDRRAGCLVGFATQCAIDPPRFVVFISNKNFTYRVARDASHLGVHVVPAEEVELARLFGESTGDEVDKFERCRWEVGPHGVPVLSDCRDRFIGRIVDTFDAGDHAGFFLDLVDVRAAGGPFFSFQRALGFEPGHEA